MSETKPSVKFGAWQPSDDEFLQELDEWTQHDLSYDYIEDFFNQYNRLPEVDQVQEHYEHRYMDAIIVKKELERYRSELFQLKGVYYER